MTKRAGPPIPIALLEKASGDPEKLLRLAKEQEIERLQRRLMMSAVESEPTGPSAESVAAHPSNPRPRPALKAPPVSRGPWVLSIEGLGRPPTFNSERTSSMSKGTLAKVREAAGQWKEAVAEAATKAAIPPLGKAFMVIQPYYPTNVVPDPDALPGACKACADGLVRAGVLPDDRRAQVALGYHVLPPITDGGPPRLTLTVFPLP